MYKSSGMFQWVDSRSFSIKSIQRFKGEAPHKSMLKWANITIYIMYMQHWCTVSVIYTSTEYVHNLEIKISLVLFHIEDK